MLLLLGVQVIPPGISDQAAHLVCPDTPVYACALVPTPGALHFSRTKLAQPLLYCYSSHLLTPDLTLVSTGPAATPPVPQFPHLLLEGMDRGGQAHASSNMGEN